MWHVIETIQLFLYILLGAFSIIAFIKITQKLNQQAEALHHRQKYRQQRHLEEQYDDIPNLQNVPDSEIFPSKNDTSKNDSIKKGMRLLSGEKVYLNESELAAVLATIQCERTEHHSTATLDKRGSLQTRF